MKRRLILGALLLAACSGEKNVVSSSSGSPATAGATAAETSEVTLPPSPSASASASAAPAGVKKDELNVLVIGIDSLRFDHTAAGGHSADVMPTLNALEKKGVSFTRFSSLSSYTAQSLGGFLGCRYPSELKRNGSFFAVYPEDELLFPELLQKAGIRTMSAHAHFYFQKDKAGFHQGFDAYDLVPGIKKNNKTDESITSPAHTEIILGHLADKANTGKRFFAFYHLLDAHDEYKTHPEGKSFGKGGKNLYDGELYFVDMHLKKILDYVDSQEWGKRTMVIVTSDHGEAFGEHKQYRHAFELWNNLTHIPLIIKAPGLAPRRVTEPRGTIDLCPTILDTFGVKPDPSFHGVSLWPELEGASAGPRDVVSELARDTNNDRKRTLIRGDWKIFELGDQDGYQLFDLKNDPGELTDLSRREKVKFQELREALKTFSGSIKEICPKGTFKLKNKKDGRPC